MEATTLPPGANYVTWQGQRILVLPPGSNYAPSPSICANSTAVTKSAASCTTATPAGTRATESRLDVKVEPSIIAPTQANNLATAVITISPSSIKPPLNGVSNGQTLAASTAAIFTCPHCKRQGVVERSEFNCRVFRCAQYKSIRAITPSMDAAQKAEIAAMNEKLMKANVTAGYNINPHASEAECRAILAADLADGCGGAFKFDGETATACGHDT